MSTATSALVRIERIGASATGSRQLREQVLAELRRTVDFDAWVWVMTDPVTGVGVAPVAKVPSFGELPATIRLKYQAGTNRWTALAQRRRPVARLSSVNSASAGDVAWRRFLAGYGILDVASVVFADRFGTWAFLDLWRGEPFSDADEQVLSGLPGALTAPLRSTVAATFGLPPPPFTGERGPVVLMLGDDLAIHSQTPLSDTWLAQLLPPEPGRPPVPASVFNVAAQLLAVEKGVDANPPTASVHLANGLWMTLRAARLGMSGQAAEGGVIAVTIEEAVHNTRREVFGRAFGLTQREREVLALLAEGTDTRQLARQLTISPYTVQDHVKSILAKTGATSRRALVARATDR